MFRIVQFIPYGKNRVVKKIKPSGDSRADYLTACEYISNINHSNTFKNKSLKNKCFIEMSCDGKEWYALA